MQTTLPVLYASHTALWMNTISLHYCLVQLAQNVWGGPVAPYGARGRRATSLSRVYSGAIPVCCDFPRLSYSRQFGMKGFCMLQERDTMSTLAGSLSSACWGRGHCTAPHGCLWYRVSGMNRCNDGTRLCEHTPTWVLNSFNLTLTQSNTKEKDGGERTLPFKHLGLVRFSLYAHQGAIYLIKIQ